MSAVSGSLAVSKKRRRLIEATVTSFPAAAVTVVVNVPGVTMGVPHRAVGKR